MMAVRCAVNSLSRAPSSTVDCCRGGRLLRHRILHLPSPLQLVILACLLVYSLADDAHELRETPLARAGHVTSVSNKGAFVIDSLEKALMYLKKYDYLNCTLQFDSRRKRRRRRRRDLDIGSTLGGLLEASEHIDVAAADTADSPIPRCGDVEIFAAFVEFQHKFSLPLTGTFTEDTGRMMSAGRCGNTDHDRLPLATDEHVTNAAGFDSLLTANHDQNVHHHAHRRSARDVTSLNNLDLRTRFRVPSVADHIRTRFERVIKRRRGIRYPSFVAEEADVSDDVKAEAEVNSPLWRMRRRRRRRETLAPSENQTVSDEQLLSGIYTKFNKDYGQPITWRVLEMAHSAKIQETEQRDTMQMAFRIWSEVTPIVFEEKTTGSIELVDIEIGFGKLRHLDCRHPFDGRGGELAHSSQTTAHKVVHFDDDECFKAAATVGQACLNLLPVAIHEIGHVLGLPHSDNRQSIMYPVYDHSKKNSEYELSTDDRRNIQDIYGVCTRGDFTAVWDWLRRRDVPGSPGPRYYYNTYFARDRWYWMYENRNNRTRYGDPATIAGGWSGLPSTIDSYTQVLRKDVLGHYSIDTYFFSGNKYYLYDDREDRVMAGYPRNISTDFGPKQGGNETIPNDLDAAYFDIRDHLIYFFKDEWVWVYSPKDANDPTRGCCEKKVKFKDLFPTYKREESVVMGNIDAVYFSYAFQRMFIFKGADVYENVHYAAGAGRNSLVRIGPWYHTWRDICDVQPTI